MLPRAIRILPACGSDSFYNRLIGFTFAPKPARDCVPTVGLKGSLVRPCSFSQRAPIGIRERCLSGADHARKAGALRQQLQCKLGSASVSSNDHQSLISLITAEPSVQVYQGEAG